MSIKCVTPQKLIIEAIIDSRGSINIPKSVREAGFFTRGRKVTVTIEIDEQPVAAPGGG